MYSESLLLWEQPQVRMNTRSVAGMLSPSGASSAMRSLIHEHASSQNPLVSSYFLLDAPFGYHLPAEALLLPEHVLNVFFGGHSASRVYGLTESNQVRKYLNHGALARRQGDFLCLRHAGEVPARYRLLQRDPRGQPAPGTLRCGGFVGIGRQKNERAGRSGGHPQAPDRGQRAGEKSLHACHVDLGMVPLACPSRPHMAQNPKGEINACTDVLFMQSYPEHQRPQPWARRCRSLALPHVARPRSLRRRSSP
jgi:hypothetical protein